MRCQADTKAAKNTAPNARKAVPVGLSKACVFCQRLYQSLQVGAEADRTVQLCMDALPVANWRSTCKDCGAQKGHSGDLYRAWISFL